MRIITPTLIFVTTTIQTILILQLPSCLFNWTCKSPNLQLHVESHP